jgi:stearoyl-CoA desaturase (delta-9 desaturase)
MTSTTLAPVSPAGIPVRDQFTPHKVLFVLAFHLGALAALWHTTWSAVAVCFLLHALFGGIGICVGYHRLLTHRAFKCPRAVDYALAFLGSQSLQGGPIEWVAHHRQHHQYPDQEGDPHGADRGFWWSHMLWIFWMSSPKCWEATLERYTPDLLRVPFYHFLGRMYLWLAILVGALLYLWGGWPFVVWGMCVRQVLTYHSTWLVNSASHSFGYKNFPIDDLSTNCWWVALLAYGEGWHNNHHAFPTSVRHGMRSWEIDPAYGFIRLLKAVGLAWDLRLPPPEKMQFQSAKTTLAS